MLSVLERMQESASVVRKVANEIEFLLMISELYDEWVRWQRPGDSPTGSWFAQ